MKKMLSVILALVLCLSVVSAVAETASITTDALVNVDEQVEGLELKIPEDQTAAEVELDALKNAAVADYFGDETVADAVVDEFFALEVVATPDTTELVPVTFKVAKEYAADAKVIVMVGIVEAENVTWTAFEGAAEGNAVTIMVAPEYLETLKDATVLVAILSK